MNKLFTKIAGGLLGISLAFGVGASISKQPASVYAAKGDSITGGNMASGVTTGWSTSGTGTYSNNGIKFDSANDYIESPDISSYELKDVKVSLKAGHNGGSGSVLTISSLNGSGTVIDSETFTPTEAYNAQSTTYHFELSGDAIIKNVRITMTSKVNNLGMKYCEVFDNTSGGSGGDSSDINDYAYTFTANQFTNGSSSSTTILSDANYSPSWTVNLTGTTYCATSSDGNKSQQFGSGSNADSFTLSTSSFTNAIKSVVVNGRAKTSASMSVTVGGSTLGTAQSVGASYQNFSFTKSGDNTFTGTLVISVTSNTGYFYIKSISVSFEAAATVDVESISLGDDISLAKGQTETIVPTINPANATDQVVIFEVLNANPSGCVTVSSAGLVTAAAVGSATIKGTSHNNSQATDTISVTVTAAIPTSLSWTKQNRIMAEGATLGSYFTNNSNVLKVVYSDSTSVTKTFGDAGLTVTLGDETVSSSKVLSLSDSGKVLKATYVENTITVHQQITIQVSPLLSFVSVTNNFSGGKSYILSSDSNSTISVAYTSLNGQATASAVSSDEDILLCDTDTPAYDDETKEGSFNITLVPGAAGTVYITITISCSGNSLSTTTDTIVIRSADPITVGDKYVKVTSLSEISNDDSFLLVNETKSVALDGSLNNLDASTNYIDVTFSGDDITSNATTRSAEFTIDKTNGYLKSSSNYYIYGQSGSNSLHSSTTTENVLNSFSFDANDNFIALSYTSTLCWNNAGTGSGGQKFRYAKSTSTITDNSTGWYHIQLYKFVEGEAPTDDESVVLTFITTYMHPEIHADDQGSGHCASNGWWTAARTHIESDLNDTQRLLFRDSYNNYYLRLQAWALANSTTFEISNTGAISSARMIPGVTFIHENTNTIAIIVIISLVSVTAIGGYFFIKRREQN